MAKEKEFDLSKIPPGPYCDGCPFLEYKKINHRLLSHILMKEGKPPLLAGSPGGQWCKYLKAWLSVQDNIKDCGVNEDYPEEEDDEEC